MTHTSTEQERAELLQMHADFEREFGSMPQDCKWSGTGFYQTSHHAWQAQEYAHKFDGFKAAWQAARRAQVVPDAYLVYAKGSTRYWVVTLNPDDVPEIYNGGETVPIYRNAAAPHPPEADHIPDAGKMVAAPVQLPEPDAWRYTDARSHFRYRGRRVGFAAEYPLLKPEPLYTEHQVSTILAQHGIKTK